jgi:hypothetical protein
VRYVLVALLAVMTVGYAQAAPERVPCEYGRVQGFVAVRSDPEYLVGTIPNKFATDTRFFSRRFNCKQAGIQIKRLDLGVYDVRVLGLPNRVPIVSAISQEGVSASVQPLEADIYRVSLRGPLERDGALVRRDVAFSLVIF